MDGKDSVLVFQHLSELNASIERMTFFSGLNTARLVFTESAGDQLGRVYTQITEVALNGVGSFFTESQVVLLSTTLVAVSLKNDLNRGVVLHTLRGVFKRRATRWGKFMVVKLEPNVLTVVFRRVSGCDGLAELGTRQGCLAASLANAVIAVGVGVTVEGGFAGCLGQALRTGTFLAGVAVSAVGGLRTGGSDFFWFRVASSPITEMIESFGRFALGIFDTFLARTVNANISGSTLYPAMIVCFAFGVFRLTVDQAQCN